MTSVLLQSFYYMFILFKVRAHRFLTIFIIFWMNKTNKWKVNLQPEGPPLSNSHKSQPCPSAAAEPFSCSLEVILDQSFSWKPKIWMNQMLRALPNLNPTCVPCHFLLNTSWSLVLKVKQHSLRCRRQVNVSNNLQPNIINYKNPTSAFTV